MANAIWLLLITDWLICLAPHYRPASKTPHVCHHISSDWTTDVPAYGPA